MTTEQYRCLIAHMMHWNFGMDKAVNDVGITDPREDVIHELWKCGWNYDEEKDRLIYEE